MGKLREQIIEVGGELGKKLKEQNIIFTKIPDFPKHHQTSYILAKHPLVKVYKTANEAYFEAMKLVGYDIETEFTLADRED